MFFLRLRRPPVSTRTYTLSPFTTLVRSREGGREGMFEYVRAYWDCADASLPATVHATAAHPTPDGATDRGASTTAVTTDRATLGTLHSRLDDDRRSEEHTSELQSLMRISYAVFCLKQKNKRNYN